MFPAGGPNPTAADMNYTVVINGAVWLGALGYYFIDARKWFTGPKITLNLDDLSESQERAIINEGLDVEHDPTPMSGTQNVPLAREVGSTDEKRKASTTSKEARKASNASNKAEV
jgi:hypothetical protein